MLATDRDNRWFIDEHWPVNAPHVQRMVSDLERRLPGLEGARIPDVGCFNGYIGCLLTTPNPATLMNAVRLLRGTYSTWGTRAFIDEPKLHGGEVIAKADIHYREYSRDEVRHLLEGAGLRVEEVRYLGLGTARSEGNLRTLVKGFPLFERLSSTRLLGSNHYVVARR